MHYATDLLVEEHQVIERMLEVLNAAAQKLEDGKAVDPDFFMKAGDFIRNFADKCHHAKEENILFKLMTKRGVPTEGGPIGQMLAEHGVGRNYASMLVDAAEELRNGNAAAKGRIIEAARGYADLLSNHIYKENNILYPMGNSVLTADDQAYLKSEFHRVEEEETGHGVHEKYLALVEEMEKQIHED